MRWLMERHCYKSMAILLLFLIFLIGFLAMETPSEYVNEAGRAQCEQSCIEEDGFLYSSRNRDCFCIVFNLEERD